MAQTKKKYNDDNPFQYANAINYGKDIITGSDDEAEAEEGYMPHLMNKAFATTIDSLLYANEMNRHWILDKKLQYLYFLNSLVPKRRGAKWYKPDMSDDIDMVQDLYLVNRTRATQMLSLLTEDQKQHLRTKTKQGVSTHEPSNVSRTVKRR